MPAGGSGGGDSSDDEALGLSQFWESLDQKQKQSLLSIRKEKVLSEVKCSSCRELLDHAIYNIETGRVSSGGGGAAGGSSSVASLARLSDGAFVSGAKAHLSKRKAIDFVNYSITGGFELVGSTELQRYLLKEPGSHASPATSPSAQAQQQQRGKQAKGKRSGKGGGGGKRGQQKPEEEEYTWELDDAEEEEEGGCLCSYCKDKYLVKFVDMLTYPRPIRKFQMLLDRSMRFAVLREMMATEVGLESVGMLELMIRNRRLRSESDDKTLEQLGFRNGLQVVISKVLGGPVEGDQAGMNEKNKQFVGDLLFGHNTKDAQGGGAGSVVETFRVRHGYQILGRTLQRLARNSVQQQWKAEVRARENERDLLASLLEEEEGENTDASKKKTKKSRRKEKEKKRKQEEAQKKKEADVEKEREMAARAKANAERAEAERRARQEQARREAEEEERRLREAMEEKARQAAAKKALEERRQAEAAAAQRERERKEAAARAAAQQRQQQVEEASRQLERLGLGGGGSGGASSRGGKKKGAAAPGSTQPIGAPRPATTAASAGSRPSAVLTEPPRQQPAPQQPRAVEQPARHLANGRMPSSAPLSPPSTVSPRFNGLGPSSSTSIGPHHQQQQQQQQQRGVPSPPMEPLTIRPPPPPSSVMVPSPPIGPAVVLHHAPQDTMAMPPPATGAAAPRFCSQCGNALVARARFCSHCGEPVLHVAAPAPPGPAVVMRATGPLPLAAHHQHAPHHHRAGLSQQQQQQQQQAATVLSMPPTLPSSSDGQPWALDDTEARQMPPMAPSYFQVMGALQTPSSSQEQVPSEPASSHLGMPPPPPPPPTPTTMDAPFAVVSGVFYGASVEGPPVVEVAASDLPASHHVGGGAQYKRPLPLFQSLRTGDPRDGSGNGKAGMAEHMLSRHPSITENVASFLCRDT